jgi:hypothetical protein
MKVGVYQTDPVLLDVKSNLEATIEKIWSADQWTSIDPIFTGCRAATA